MKVKPQILNFFNFLSKKEQRELPISIRVEYYPESILEEEKRYLKLRDKIIYFPEYISDYDLLQRDFRSLDFTGTPIKRFPDKIHWINGSLEFDETDIEYLPDNLTITGYLSLNHCKNFKTLPNNLTVKHTLYCHDTPITSLPAGLSIGENLIINNTNVKELRNDITVNGIVEVYDTPLRYDIYMNGFQESYPNLKIYPNK